MHALVVVAHPDQDSFTHAVARTLTSEIRAPHTFEIADLIAEGFDPRYAAADLALFRSEAAPPADVLAEQKRIDGADALVLVYPVYWWSFPGVLKGWIDRVFTHGWAYEETPDGKVAKKMGRLKVHLLGIGGANLRTYARRGYYAAMRTQIDEGIFDYVGAAVKTSELILLPDADSPEAHLKTARQIGRRLFAD
ncbi:MULTISPECIES: NAD(P)H-dependent oxidoreductase [Pantoea]|uniref:NAD(P)H-dependent oxidoreductase n=1 Tax=Pantoea TaxID=53335 RepID=UPI000660FA0D|nr:MULTISPECIES: NAD(P)H-dependent oxidoreductase [Pantoea]MBS6438630.1 NAD(P)H-dependent oxidoreductase [Pantoea sp.]MDU2728234.1 NAD(P)H-dependent oxidoreductase [Pantoea sp.]